MEFAGPNSSRNPDKAVAATDAEAMCRVVDSAVLDLWRVIDTLGRIRPEQQPYYRGSPVYEDVKRLAMELARMGCDIVTGGGPGLMQAANEGERLGDSADRTRSYGLRIDLSFEQEANPFVERLFHHGTFFSRLHHFVRLSSAYVVVPGGIGTSLELMMIWQLLQVRQLFNTPLILVGPMWRELVDWAERRMTGPVELASPQEVAIPTCVETIEGAIDEIRRHRQAWARNQARMV